MSIQHRPGRRSPWVARVRLSDGREQSRSFGRKTDAQAWLEEQRSRIRSGDWVDPRRGDILWDVYVDQVLEGKMDLSERTIETYQRSAVRVAPYLEGIPLNRITPERLDEVRASLSRQYAPETVSKDVRLIRMVLLKAVAHGRLRTSPARELLAPVPKKRPMRILTRQEVADIAAALPKRYRSWPIVAAYTGLRFGELAGLHTDQVDMLRRRLAVTRALHEPSGRQPYLGPPKSEASARTITLSSSVVEVLAGHLEEFPPIDGVVWRTAKGNYMRRGSWSRIWRSAIAKVGIECRSHDLRHTQAAWLIEAGEHPKTIQQRLGHGSIRVTMDRYGHLMDGLDEAAAEHLEEGFLGADAGKMRAKSADVIALP